MTDDAVKKMALDLWSRTKDGQLNVAKEIVAKYPLPPSVHVMIPELPRLLTALQRASFLHGAGCALLTVDSVLKFLLEEAKREEKGSERETEEVSLSENISK